MRDPTVPIKKTLRRQLKMLAAQQGTTIRDLVEKAIQKYLGQK